MNVFEGKRVLFYVPGMDVVNNGVYYSQVIGLARYIDSLGAKSLVVYSTPGKPECEEFVVDGVSVVRCHQSEKYVPLPFLPTWYLNITSVAERQMRDLAPTHVYIRDPFSGAAGLKIAKRLRAKVVFSRRGAGLSAFETNLKCRIKDWISERYVSRILKRAVHVNSVSQNLDSLMAPRTKAARSVLPCCVMEEKFKSIDISRRRQIRMELGFTKDAKIVVYSGGVGGYQCTDEMMSLLKEIHAADASVKFLILTGGLAYVKDRMAQIGLDSDCVRILRCSPTEVSDYLQTADVGVILRYDDMVNRVASPVKIGEYLSSGLGIIVSPWIGDVGNMLATKPFAYMCGNDYDITKIVHFINSISEGDRALAVGFARNYYTYTGNREAVNAMFA